VFELADRPAPANLRKTGMPPYLYPSATMKEAAAWGANFDRCIGTGAFSDALKATSEMVRLTPKAAQAYAFRGFVHGRLNEVAEAERDYQTAIRMGYPPAFVHVYLGTYQSNRRAYREALDNLLRGIALDPAIAPVARAQALVPALGLKKYDVALSLAEALLAANPSDPALKDQVARIRQLAAGTAKK
jgi:tetratricopeptide (TPR) repeat protein